MSLIILQVIPSLIGYIIIVLNFNGATWSFFPEHQFRRWAELMSIFLIISFRLEQQAWFRVCVLPMFPITFRFIIPLTWCRRWLITSSWNLSTNVSWSLPTIWLLPSCVSKFRMRNTILDPRWIVLSSTTFLPPPNTNLLVFCVVSWFPCYPTYVMFYRGVLPSLMSRMSWALLHLLRILGTVILLTITILSWSPCCF